MAEYECEEIRLLGYPICPGIAIGKSFFFTVADEKVPEFAVPHSEIDKEVARYYRALRSSRKDLRILKEQLHDQGGDEAAAILSSHLEMMKDPLMTTQIEEEIRAKRKNTEYVFKTVIGEYEQRFSKISDQFFRERVKDFQDISRRIIAHLRKDERRTLADIKSRYIVFAHELTPSDTAEANTEYIEAFVTRSGAETSHVAIMARAKGIPFVSSVNFPDLSYDEPTWVIVDGRLGEVIINPNKETLAHYRGERKKIKTHVKGLHRANTFLAETVDGYTVRLSANVEMFSELEELQKFGGGGIGLFRSEYLYLAKDAFPSEEEQFLVYRSIVEKIDGHTSVIRTFDLGGDKFGNFHLSRYEQNPYLGCRGIRLMLKERAIFKTQIQAILRASAFGEVSILFPMISGLPELREAKAVVEEAKAELNGRGVPFSRNVPIGCMIEVPSAAVTCDLLARECDFLSIGTNDLVQYALAVDRGNPAMSYLYTPTHPSVLRLIKMVVQEGCKATTPVSVCGEVAADPKFIALLLGLGVQELSVASLAIPIVKNVIRHISIVEATELAAYALTLATATEVEAALHEGYRKLGIAEI